MRKNIPVLGKTVCRFLVAVLLTTCLIVSAQAQKAELQYLHGLGDTRYHELNSEVIEQTYHIYVRLPKDHDPEKQYPTIYLLDGGATFPMLASYYGYLKWAQDSPTAIIVGISYGTNDWKNGNHRSRDFTAKSEERDYWGGADNFQQIFRKELFPLIEKNYPSNPDQRIIFGQSLGGQFVLYTAQTNPDMFWGYIASNPALHRNLPLFLETTPPKNQQTIQPRLFVSSGSEDVPRFREPAMKWIEHWTAREDLPWQLKTVTLEGDNHFSAVTNAFRQGIRWLFSKDGN